MIFRIFRGSLRIFNVVPGRTVGDAQALTDLLDGQPLLVELLDLLLGGLVRSSGGYSASLGNLARAIPAFTRSLTRELSNWARLAMKLKNTQSSQKLLNRPAASSV